MVVNRKTRKPSTRNKLASDVAQTASQSPLPIDESLTVETAESKVETGGDRSIADTIVIGELVIQPIDDPTIVTFKVEPPPPAIIDEIDKPMSLSVVERVDDPIEATIKPTDKPSETLSTSRNKSKVSSNKSVQPTKGDKIMTQDAKSSTVVAKKESAIAVTGSALHARPVTPNALNFVGMISSAGDRPIGASTMVIFGTYLNGRPIEASSLKLFEMLPGDRPVFFDEVSYVPGTADGGRPVMISPAGLMNAGEMMGSRPTFSNDIVDPNPAILMGYLD